MQTIPQNIPNEIVRSYSGRFIIKRIELERLVADIKTLLSQGLGDNYLKLKFLVGLRNGVVYETEDLSVLLQEENSSRLRIVLLVVSGEVFSQSGELERRIIVYFSRGGMNRAGDYVDMSNGFRFNISAHGMGYVVREKNRQYALDTIENIEDRLKKSRRIYSDFPEINLKFGDLLVSIFFYALVGIAFYFLIWFGWQFLGFFPDGWGDWFVFPKFTEPLVASIILVYVVTMIGSILAFSVGKTFLWFMPPSLIEIGDEAEDYQKQNNLRQLAFWTVIVGGIVGILVNLIT